MPITRNELSELFDYCPNTGHFTARKTRRGSKRKIGDIVGVTANTGYIVITVKYKKYLAHRLAFLYMEGTIPPEIDHSNGVKTDNRWSNLQDSCRKNNAKNLPRRKDNTSNVTGVNFRSGKWRAYISRNHIGTFDTFDEAVNARKQAEINYGYHKNHGRIQI